MMVLLALFADIICFADLKTNVLTHMTFAAYHSCYSLFFFHLCIHSYQDSLFYLTISVLRLSTYSLVYWPTLLLTCKSKCTCMCIIYQYLKIFFIFIYLEITVLRFP